MGIALGDKIKIALFIIGTFRITAGCTRRDPQATQHGRHRRGIVITIAGADIEEKVLNRVHIGRRGGDGIGIGNGAQITFDRFDLFIGGCLAGGHLDGQVGNALRKVCRQLQIAIENLGWIVSGGFEQSPLGHDGLSANHRIGVIDI